MLGCNHPNATQFATAKLHAMGARYLTSNGRKHSEKEGGGAEFDAGNKQSFNVGTMETRLSSLCIREIA